MRQLRGADVCRESKSDPERSTVDSTNHPIGCRRRRCVSPSGTRVWHGSGFPGIDQHDPGGDPLPALWLRRRPCRPLGQPHDHPDRTYGDHSHRPRRVRDRHQPPRGRRWCVLHHQPFLRHQHRRRHWDRAVPFASDFGRLLPGRIRGSLRACLRVGRRDLRSEPRPGAG